MKLCKECRNCESWETKFPHGMTAICENSKSERYKTTPLYDSTCKFWKPK